MWHFEGHKVAWQNLQTNPKHWDVIVVGGGITGAGIAREAARRGLAVLLLERQDFAWGTSSRSSKMVHGGLRYMAQGDFQTTRHSVHERERLLKEAPGLVDLMHYVMPHYRQQFPPAILFNLLLLCYDFFAGKRYRRYFTAKAYLERVPFLKKQGLNGVTQFADAVTDDSRLVMRVLHEAVKDGATCLNYVAVTQLLKEQGQVTGVEIRNELNQESLTVQADVVINATGAWVDELRGQLNRPKKIRPARGSHVIIAAERLPVTESFTILHPDDKRPIFVYPWEGRTVLGTTDIDHGALGNTEASMSQKELEYLLKLTQIYFPQQKISAKDVIASFSGVRPLVSSGALNPSKEKRNHSVWLEDGLVSVSGGKLTTFRLIALDTLEKAKHRIKHWPNQRFPKTLFTPINFQSELLNTLPQAIQKRLLGFYGHQAQDLLAYARVGELEQIQGLPILWAELRWSLANECVQHLDDLLLRRTRIGLLLEQGGEAVLSKVQELCRDELGWDDARWQKEKARYQSIWQAHYSLPVVKPN